jgi:hypothetical protein
MAAYDIVAINYLLIFIADPNAGQPVTHDTHQVIDDLNRRIPGGIGRRNVYYRSTQGHYQRLLVENGIFSGFTSCGSSQNDFLDKIADGQTHLMNPASVQRAMDLLNSLLTEDEKREIAQIPKEDLITYHFSLGRWIRNSFNLWAEDSKLLEALGSVHPDDASGILIERYWRSLQPPNDR